MQLFEVVLRPSDAIKFLTQRTKHTRAEFKVMIGEGFFYRIIYKAHAEIFEDFEVKT